MSERKMSSAPRTTPGLSGGAIAPAALTEQSVTPAPRTPPTTCIETIGGDPDTAIRLSFQIKVF